MEIREVCLRDDSIIIANIRSDWVLVFVMKIPSLCRGVLCVNDTRRCGN